MTKQYTDDQARAAARQSHVSQPACECRNAYGFPYGAAPAGRVASERPAPYHMWRAGSEHDAPLPVPDLGPEPDWRAHLPEAERAGLETLQERVRWAVAGFVEPDLARWVTDECLWQIRMELVRAGRVVLPDVGTLELVDLQDGSRCLLASQSAGLGASEVDHE